MSRRRFRKMACPNVVTSGRSAHVNPSFFLATVATCQIATVRVHRQTPDPMGEDKLGGKHRDPGPRRDAKCPNRVRAGDSSKRRKTPYISSNARTVAAKKAGSAMTHGGRADFQPARSRRVNALCCNSAGALDMQWGSGMRHSTRWIGGTDLRLSNAWYRPSDAVYSLSLPIGSR